MERDLGARKEIIHRHRPVRSRGFRLGILAAPVHRRLRRVGAPIDANEALVEYVHIPDDEGACREIVRAFGD